MCNSENLRRLLASAMVVLFLGRGVACAEPLDDSVFAAHQRGDAAEAVRLYREAAMQGNVHAQYTLGMMYLDGAGGVATDDKEGAKWIRMAAERGYVHAQE